MPIIVVSWAVVTQSKTVAALAQIASVQSRNDVCRRIDAGASKGEDSPTKGMVIGEAWRN